MDKNLFAPTPPMGWNSWDCYGASVRENEVRKNAEYMAKNLKEYGWNLITVDIQWSEPEATGTEYRNLPKLCMDEYGRLIPAPNRFPSAAEGRGFKPLADYVHSLGLKFGIHIMRGIPRQAAYADCPVKGTSFTARDAARGDSICAWNMDMYGVNAENGAGQAYLDSILELYSQWGVDFIKCDDMTWRDHRSGGQYHSREAAMYRRAIDKTGRPIVFSSSPGTFNTDAHQCLVENLNMWRISDDFWDSWGSLLKQYGLLTDWNPHMGPGHFPDADMLPIGHLSVRYNNEQNASRYTNLTKDEQYFMFSLWSIARSPLILGCELTDMDEFSLSLVQNRDMVACNQFSTENRMVYRREQTGAWAAKGQGGEVWLGAFNLSDAPAASATLLSELGLSGQWRAVDVWTGKEVSAADGVVALPLRPHQGTLIKLTPQL